MASLVMHGQYGVIQDSYVYHMQDGIIKDQLIPTDLGVLGQGLDISHAIV